MRVLPASIALLPLVVALPDGAAEGCASGASCAASGAHALLQYASHLHGQGKKEGADREWEVFRHSDLPGPDFMQGDAAWKQRLDELVARHPSSFSASHAESNRNSRALAAAAPLTVLYALAHNHARLFPDGRVPDPLRVHVLGASYPFEGRGDWSLLSEAMPPGVSLEVSLVLGTPEQADGVPEVRIQRLKKGLCGKRGRLEVKCIESYYQNVMHDVEKPHLAMMFNPGFPQVHRRTWDATLLYLLQSRIPSAVSAQTVSSRGWPRAAEPWSAYFTEYANEDFPINATLVAYGADTWGATGSPFPIVEGGDGDSRVIKNAVIELFQGQRPGAPPLAPPASLPKKDVSFIDHFDWQKAEQRTDDNTMHDEMKAALLTPVSDAFVRAQDGVYSQYLGQLEERPGFQKKPAAVQERARAIAGRMRNSEPLLAKDWIFLKTHFDLD